jgi:hypothetical protein
VGWTGMLSYEIGSSAGGYVPKAFPSALSAQAASIAKLVPDHPHRLLGYDVLLNGETLEIPVRLYFPKLILRTPWCDDSMLLCLGTRHHDGFVRQKCVMQLLQRSDDWAIPYIVQLLGEYVVEIAQVINDALPLLDQAPYQRFIAENASYIATTERRIRSYWSCYYRDAYPDIESYPPYIAFTYLKA